MSKKRKKIRVRKIETETRKIEITEEFPRERKGEICSECGKRKPTTKIGKGYYCIDCEF